MKKIILLSIIAVILLCGCKEEGKDNKYSVVGDESDKNDELTTTEKPVVIEPNEFFNLLGTQYKDYEVFQNDPLIVKVMAKYEGVENSAFAFFSKNGILVQYEDKWYEIVLPPKYKEAEDFYFGYNDLNFIKSENENMKIMSILWTDTYSTHEVDEDIVKNTTIENGIFEDVAMDWICYDYEDIKLNVKYQKFEDTRLGYQIIGYVMLGEDYGISFNYYETDEQLDIPDLENIDFLKSIFFVREYK